MSITFRQYRPYEDTLSVAHFLDRTYPATDLNRNWLRPRWEYMVYSVQDGNEEKLAPIGLWEAGGEIVAMVNFEDGPGQAFFQVDPDYTALQGEMLAYAESGLSKPENGTHELTLFVNDFDIELEALAGAAGYVKDAGAPDVTARFDVAQGFPDLVLPDGFRVTDRRENNDLRRINRVLWRGFNHEGPPPDKYVAGRADVEKAPLYRDDLNVMVQAPEGHFVSYAGIWYVPVSQVAYVEPVATDPDYRRRGFGKVAVLEAVRRASVLGATRAIVISGQEFYKAIGFTRLFEYYRWRKTW